MSTSPVAGRASSSSPGELDDARPQLLHAAQRERARHQFAQPGVLRRIHQDHHRDRRGRHARALLDGQRVPPVLAQPGIGQRGAYVGVAEHHPHRAVGQVDLAHRFLGAGAVVGRIGVVPEVAVEQSGLGHRSPSRRCKRELTGRDGCSAAGSHVDVRRRRRADQHGRGQRGECGRGLDPGPALTCDERETGMAGPLPDHRPPVGHERAEPGPGRAHRPQPEPGDGLDPLQARCHVELIGAGVAGIDRRLVRRGQQQIVPFGLEVEAVAGLARPSATGRVRVTARDRAPARSRSCGGAGRGRSAAPRRDRPPRRPRRPRRRRPARCRSPRPRPRPASRGHAS